MAQHSEAASSIRLAYRTSSLCQSRLSGLNSPATPSNPSRVPAARRSESRSPKNSMAAGTTHKGVV
ncbi:hypothetical protein D3C80_1793450 [compost metagenome]